MNRMRVIIFFVSFLAVILFSSASSSFVYVSMGCKAYAYHVNYKCSRLKRCIEEGHVKKVTIEKAKEMGRTPCKVCSK